MDDKAAEVANIYRGFNYSTEVSRLCDSFVCFWLCCVDEQFRAVHVQFRAATVAVSNYNSSSTAVVATPDCLCLKT